MTFTIRTKLYAGFGIVLLEAHAINRKGEILAMGMGKMDHGGMADHICAPAPPLSFLLTPTNAP